MAFFAPRNDDLLALQALLTIATVTDRESVDWAEANLKSVGWTLGKHAGVKYEQRRKHPRSTDADRVEY